MAKIGAPIIGSAIAYACMWTTYMRTMRQNKYGRYSYIQNRKAGGMGGAAQLQHAYKVQPSKNEGVPVSAAKTDWGDHVFLTKVGPPLGGGPILAWQVHPLMQGQTFIQLRLLHSLTWDNKY